MQSSSPPFCIRPASSLRQVANLIIGGLSLLKAKRSHVYPWTEPAQLCSRIALRIKAAENALDS